MSGRDPETYVPPMEQSTGDYQSADDGQIAVNSDIPGHSANIAETANEVADTAGVEAVLDSTDITSNSDAYIIP